MMFNVSFCSSAHSGIWGTVREEQATREAQQALTVLAEKPISGARIPIREPPQPQSCSRTFELTDTKVFTQ